MAELPRSRDPPEASVLPACSDAVPDQESVVSGPSTGGGNVRLKPTGAEQVRHRHAVTEHRHIGDEPPVTAPPHALTAQDRHPLLLRGAKHEGEGVAEVRGPGVRGVRPERRNRPPRVGHVLVGRRPATPSQPFFPSVGRTAAGQPVLECASSHVRVAPASRKPAHVNHRVDRGVAQESRELPAVQRPVPDGQKSRRVARAGGLQRSIRNRTGAT
jgi:hypothetical protein